MFKYFKKDILASLVVFFVALPLCLGIAVASGADPFSGIIAGVIGGVVIGFISKSAIGVSGPAAGLVVIVATAIASLGFKAFLLAVVISGVIQIVLGLLKAGVIGYYFPSSVIKGMLSAIGIMIFIGQFSDALGLKQEMSSIDIFNLMDYITPGAVIVTMISLVILIVWESVLAKKHVIFKLIPGPLVAVIMGIIYQVFLGSNEGTVFFVDKNLLVNVPIPESVGQFVGQFTLPDFTQILSREVWVVAITIAIVGSLESLLSAEAADKLDPLKRITPSNRELIAQGVGNGLSGLIGGIPVTQVIVRSSANVMSGGRTKLSAIMHGFLLLFSVILIPKVLNLIPMAVLSAILLIIGYKLANLRSYPKIFKLGKSQFIPFITTVVAIVATDLLIGIMSGLTIGIIVILINNYKNSHFLHIQEKDDNFHRVKMTLAEEVTFLNKGAILRELNTLPDGTILEIDVRNTRYLDYDILEVLDDFLHSKKGQAISVRINSDRGYVENPSSVRQFFGHEIIASH